MNIECVRKCCGSVAAVMSRNSEYLSELDAQCGDGDLGLTMKNGMAAAVAALETDTGTDLGQAFFAMSRAFNTAAPSTLGTIISFGMMGMARSLKGQTGTDIKGFADALQNGLETIMEKAGSKENERTILDSLIPATRALYNHADEGWTAAFASALQAAQEGVGKTKTMVPVHGRAAYYGEKLLGKIDGGAYAGMLIFQGISDMMNC